MSIFKDIPCAACQEKTKILSRTKLRDGNFLCSSCMKAVPSFMRSSVKKGYDITDYHMLISYIKESNEELRPIFRETDRYYSVHIDSENHLFYIGKAINDNTVFFKLHNVLNFDLVFKGENVREGFGSTKVFGKLLMEIEGQAPYFYYDTVLDNYASVKAQKIMHGTKIKYDNPKGMNEFREFFLFIWNESIALNSYHYEETTQQYEEAVSSAMPFELQQAMALFMFDDLKDVTISKLKLQRNRLMQTFHPDHGNAEDTQYAQKINNAYEVIKGNLF